MGNLHTASAWLWRAGRRWSRTELFLRAISNQTGTVIDVPPGPDERVVGVFGPGRMRDVLASLLNGSRFNYLKDGSFNLSGLPPGTYTIEAWHETLGTSTQTVTLGANETKALDFVFKSQPRS